MTGFTKFINLFDFWHVQIQPFFPNGNDLLVVISTNNQLKNIFRVVPKFAYGIPFLIRGVERKIHDRKDQIAVQRQFLISIA